MYSSNEPPNNFGCPLNCILPIRFLRGVLALGNKDLLLILSLKFSHFNDFRKYSCLESKQAILLVVDEYSWNF